MIKQHVSKRYYIIARVDSRDNIKSVLYGGKGVPRNWDDRSLDSANEYSKKEYAMEDYNSIIDGIRCAGFRDPEKEIAEFKRWHKIIRMTKHSFILRG